MSYDTGADQGETALRRDALVAKGKRAGRLVAQFAVVIAVYAVGCALALVLPIAIPGNIVGMMLLLALLGLRLVKPRHIDGACDCLLANMPLFFVPAGVAIMGCLSLLEGSMVKFLLVCVITTVLVFASTALTVVLVSRLLDRRKGAAAAGEER